MSDLKTALTKLQEQFGDSIMLLSQQEVKPQPVISTGSFSLDKALGIGGLPIGKISEVFGETGSGKTTLALSVIAQAQKKGFDCAFIDTEHVLDLHRAKKIGVDLDKLVFSQPDYGEQAMEMVDGLCRTGIIKVIVVDSVAALTPKSEIEGDMGDSHMGLQARLMSQALRKITGIAAKTNTTVIFTNQIRMKIGVMFGNPETTTGGNALKFYSSVRMDIRQKEKIMKGDEVVGHVRRVKVVKNKVAPPFREATFNIIFPRGIDKESSILDAAIEYKVVEKSGSWFKYGEKQLAQGRDSAIEALREDKKLAKELEKEVRKVAKAN